MASTNKTDNYELSQFSVGDAFEMTDYNADMLAIDTAIKALADIATGGPFEMQTSSTHLQWRYVGASTWINFIALSAITGPAGADGSDGANGRGITSIARTSGTGAAGTTDTYTITYSDSTTSTFTVYNGADGSAGSGDVSASTVTFTVAATKEDVSTGDTLATLFGKLKKWYASFGALAWLGTVGSTQIDANAVTNAKLAQMAAKTVKGNLGTSTADPSDVTMLDVAEYALDAGTVATSIADAEYLPISVSATSTKKITWANVKTAIQTALNSVFATLSSGKVQADQASATITAVTTDTTLALTHAGVLVQVNSATGKTITVPPNSSVAFPVGTEIEILRYGVGTVAIAAGSGVTIRSAGSYLNIAAQYNTVALKKLATDEWLLVGALV